MVISNAITSLAASIYFIRTLIPSQLQSYLSHSIYSLVARFSSQFTVTIDEFDGKLREPMCKSAQTYLATKHDPSIRSIKVSKPDEGDDEANDLLTTIGHGEEIVDVFQGVKFTWYSTYKESLATNPRAIKKAQPTAYYTN